MLEVMCAIQGIINEDRREEIEADRIIEDVEEIALPEKKKSKEEIEKIVEQKEENKDANIWKQFEIVKKEAEKTKEMWDDYFSPIRQHNRYVFEDNYEIKKKKEKFLPEKVETITYRHLKDVILKIKNNTVIDPDGLTRYKMWCWFSFNRAIRKIYFGSYRLDKKS